MTRNSSANAAIVPVCEQRGKSVVPDELVGFASQIENLQPPKGARQPEIPSFHEVLPRVVVVEKSGVRFAADDLWME
jgi:hypothetical protein